MRCNDARSICVYELHIRNQPEMRRVESLSSASSVATEAVLATHRKPGSRAGRSSTAATRSHQSMSTPAAESAGAMLQASTTPC